MEVEKRGEMIGIRNEWGENEGLGVFKRSDFGKGSSRVGSGIIH